jgi:hypothetical protein
MSSLVECYIYFLEEKRTGQNRFLKKQLRPKKNAKAVTTVKPH